MLRNSVFKSLQNILRLKNSKQIKIAVAVSGGADSMCLAYLANQWCKKHDIEITVVIIDHAIRKESKQEACNTAKFLKKENFNVHVIKLTGLNSGNANLQHKARELRYQALTDFCNINNIGYLLLGHQKNDQAETVMLSLIRGSGVDGLSAMNNMSKKNDIYIVRPLLDIYRKDIEDFLSDINWPWVTDPSNSNIKKYERARVRKLINEYNASSNIVARLCLVASNMQRTRCFIEHVVNDTITNICQFSQLGNVVFKKAYFLQLDEEIALRVLRDLLKKISGNYYAPRLVSLTNLYKKMISENYATKTLCGCEVILHQDIFNIIRETAKVEKKKYIDTNKKIIWDNRVVVITKKTDLFISCLGKNGYSQLKQIKGHKVKLPNSRLLYSTPAIFDSYDNLKYSVLYNNGDIIINYLNIDIK